MNTKVLSCWVAVGLAVMATPALAVENPFVGNWALTIPGGRAGWLTSPGRQRFWGQCSSSSWWS